MTASLKSGDDTRCVDGNSCGAGFQPAVPKRTTPRPFLKWAGGKGQLLPELMECVQKAAPFERYHELFVGGGALFFELYRTKRLGTEQAVLSDANARLVEAYTGVKENVGRVIELLHEHKIQHSEDYYYRVRAQVPEDPIERAARIIYLNKTGFNGLFRENSRGQFNVPFGRYENPMICDEENLRAVADALQYVRVEARNFETVLKHAKIGDFVYFDPPYHPVSKTASFTSYEKNGFGEDAQRELARVALELHRKRVKVLLSNSMTDLIREIYRKPFTIETVLAKRSINSKPGGRGRIEEALIRNY